MQETNQKMQETTREALLAQREETKELGKAVKGAVEEVSVSTDIKEQSIFNLPTGL